MGSASWLTNDIAHYSAARSAVADTTSTNTVLAWHFTSLTAGDLTALWGGDGSGGAGETNPVMLTLRDLDQDRADDQAVGSNVVFGYLQVLDDDITPPSAPGDVTVIPSGWTNVNSYTLFYDASSDASGILHYRYATNAPSGITNGQVVSGGNVISGVFEGEMTNWLFAVDDDNDRTNDGLTAAGKPSSPGWTRRRRRRSTA